jgi:hypothetical protein
MRDPNKRDEGRTDRTNEPNQPRHGDESSGTGTERKEGMPGTGPERKEGLPGRDTERKESTPGNRPERDYDSGDERDEDIGGGSRRGTEDL